jgi:hypothetical protein
MDDRLPEQRHHRGGIQGSHVTDGKDGNLSDPEYFIVEGDEEGI